MNLTILSILILAHFLGDFILQSREMGKKKSNLFQEPWWLFGHGFIIFLTTVVCLLPHKIDFAINLQGSLISALLHMLIDSCTWNIYKWVRRKEDPATFKYWEDHHFYITIGGDQMLHMLTLLIIADQVF